MANDPRLPRAGCWIGFALGMGVAVAALVENYPLLALINLALAAINLELLSILRRWSAL